MGFYKIHIEICEFATGKQLCPFNNKVLYNLLLKPPAIQNQGSISRSLQHEVGSCVDFLSHYYMWVPTTRSTKSPLLLMNSHMMWSFKTLKPGQYFSRDGLAFLIIPRSQTHMKWGLDEKGLITNNLQRDESLFLISAFDFQEASKEGKE